MNTSHKKLLVDGIDGQVLLTEFEKLNKKISQLFAGNAKSGKENSESKKFYSRKEAKELLSVSYPTLNSWAKRGILKPCRIGSRVLYRAEDIENAVIPMTAIRKRGE